MTDITAPNPAVPASARRSRPAAFPVACALGLAWGLAGCGSLWPAKSPQPAVYSLQVMEGTAASRRDEQTPARPDAAALAGPVLVVQVPLAAPGFDTTHIVYTQQPNRLQIFARHEWVDTPARMLAPLLVAALERGGAFRAVVQAPSAATGAMQLDTQLLRLQQEFGPVPSRVRLVLRAQLVDTGRRQVMATREFEQVVPSTSEDAPGGVAAAQQAANALLDDLARWCQGVAPPPP
jgi:cholesterol transport system auxiliary component